MRNERLLITAFPTVYLVQSISTLVRKPVALVVNKRFVITEFRDFCLHS